MYSHRIPKSCSALTDRVCALVPAVMRENHVAFAFTEQATEYPSADVAHWNRLTSDALLGRSPYSYDITCYRPFSVRVEYDDTPCVSEGDTRCVTLTLICNPSYFETTRKLGMRLLLPDGWSVGKYDKTVSLLYPQHIHGLMGTAKTSFTVTVGDRVEAVNRAYAELTSPTMPYPVMIPMTFIG